MSKMISLEIFSNSGYEIRGGLVDGEPYFIAKDIADALGYSDTQAMTRRLDDDEVFTYTDNSSGQLRHIKTVNESGLYNAILGSKKPEAKQFKKWVTSEVLPSVRKHGMYAKAELLADTDLLIDALNQLRDERNKAVKEKAYIGNKREATAMATASTAVRKAKKLELMLDESSEWASMKRVQIRTGKDFKWSKLKKVSKELNIPPRKIFDANYGEVNSYHSSVWLEAYNIDIAQVA